MNVNKTPTPLKTVYLLGCSKRKSREKTNVENMYQGTFFKKALKYAKLQNGDILVLSAKHHALELNSIIEPYQQTLKEMSKQECKEWASTVKEQLSAKGYDLARDKFIFITGKDYYKYLIPYITHYEIKGEGMRQGEKLHLLDEWCKQNNNA